MDRTCDGCSECCKGWLQGHVMGHDFYSGKKCYYLQNNCTIYENRPINPCKSYDCYWLASDDLPMWMKPNLCKALVTQRRTEQGLHYFQVLECGEKMDSEVLSWLIIWALNNDKNLEYQVNGGFNKIGSKEFLEANI